MLSKRTIYTFLLSLLTLSILTNTSHAGPPVLVGSPHAAAPTVLVVSLESSNNETGTGTVPDAIDLTPANWKVNGTTPTNVYRYSITWDEDKLVPNSRPISYPVIVRHKIYLRLSQTLQNGTTYNITTPYGNTSLVFNSRTTFCESIKVNQVGYAKASTVRFANYGVFMGNGGSIQFSSTPTYDVINETTGQAVLSNQTSTFMGDDTAVSLSPTSGEYVYRLSLNNVPPSTYTYFVSVPGCGRSRSFGVGDAFSRLASYVATRRLYHQRCGIALAQPYTNYTRAICHSQVAFTRSQFTDVANQTISPYGIQVPAGTPTQVISGGYHDAGNFQRRGLHAFVPLMMLAYFEAFPTHFIDRQYNIPESGNGVPDFLDEALWGLKIWEQLQIKNPNDPEYGGIQSGTMEAFQPNYGTQSAANMSQVVGSFQVTEYTTVYSVGLFAHSSRLLRPYNSIRADELLNEAKLAWSFLQRRYNVNAVQSLYMYAALEMYLATGDQTYHNIFKNDANAIVVNNTAGWPEQYLEGNVSARCQSPHFLSYLLATNANTPTDATIVQALKNKIITFANNGGYMGPLNQDTVIYPAGANKFYDWGAMTASGRYANVYALASLFTTDQVRKQLYINAASILTDYSLGLNPMNMSYYTGLGTDQPNSPLSLDGYFTKFGLSDGVTNDHLGHPIGNIPGMLIYGPTSGQSQIFYQLAVTNKTFPAFTNLPVQRHYVHGWSNIAGNEDTIYETSAWNIPILAFLYDVSQDTTVPQPSTDAGTQTDAATSLDASTVPDATTPDVTILDSSKPDATTAIDSGVDASKDVSVVQDSQTPSTDANVSCVGPQPPGEVRIIYQTRNYACIQGTWQPSQWQENLNVCR